MAIHQRATGLVVSTNPVDVVKELRCSCANHAGPEEDVRLIEDRIRWGKAVRQGWGDGFSGRPYAACKSCRAYIRQFRCVWRYHKG